MGEQQYLANLGITALNEMQQQVSSTYNAANDLLLLSPTGSGKTLAFSLIIQKRLSDEATGKIQALIIAPTRELALQIEQVLRKMPNHPKVTCLYGGNDLRTEKNKLKEAPQILVGTPGRIIYHLERHNIDLSELDTLVLDEFDKSLELGFHEQMEQIVAETGTPFQMLTSATELEEIPPFLTLKNVETINYLHEKGYAPDLTFRTVTASPQNKLKALLKLICKLGSEQKTLIFCNHREAVDHISELLADRDIIHDVFHGGLEQADRELALLKFRNGSTHILLTTDLAARGLDIPEVDAIIHYQLPYKQDAFVHRNGRTARMQAKGTVYLMLKPEDDFPYLTDAMQEEILEEEYPLPANSKMTTLMITAGKRDKVSKGDIVGYLLKIAGIAKDEVGMIEVKEKNAFVAVTRSSVTTILQKGNNGKIKGTKVRILRS
ncbi:DEAD/DEAH box helicase [Sphingobacterium chungjuense]|uniref:DEAD/DEAH box helicase n=1 Tax=Sphingobacterium chungjuense TaxID=2675553 RepID=UPI00140947D2|nr:DEAD/DEAH box helicase [Sphingobacterium chungjuense]